MTKPKPKEPSHVEPDPALPLTSWVQSQNSTTGNTEFKCRKCNAQMWLGPTGAIRFVKMLLFWSKVHDHTDGA